MKLYVMIHKNLKINCFTQPIFTDVEPEKFAIQESRSLQICKLEETTPYKNLKLYFLGYFDDETGDLFTLDDNNEPLLRELLNCSSLIKKRFETEGVEYVASVPINSERKEA